MNKITISIVLVLLSISFVSAAGVTAQYWNGPDPNPLNLNPGETRDIQYFLMNQIGDENITIRADVVNGTDIAKITDASNIYKVPKGTKDVAVNVRVSVPTTAKLGDKYDVGLVFSTISEPKAGSFSILSAYERHFDVIIPLPAASQPVTQAETNGSSWVITLIVLAIVVIVLAILFLQRKGKQKRNKN